MAYQLLRADNGAVATKNDDVDAELAAMTWAREWLENYAEHDRYRLESLGQNRPILMIRTVAGQWYAMPIEE